MCDPSYIRSRVAMSRTLKRFPTLSITGPWLTHLSSDFHEFDAYDSFIHDLTVFRIIVWRSHLQAGSMLPTVKEWRCWVSCKNLFCSAVEYFNIFMTKDLREWSGSRVSSTCHWTIPSVKHWVSCPIVRTIHLIHLSTLRYRARWLGCREGIRRIPDEFRMWAYRRGRAGAGSGCLAQSPRVRTHQAHWPSCWSQLVW